MNALLGTPSDNTLALCKGVFIDMSHDQWMQLRRMPIRNVFSHLSVEQKSPFLYGVLNIIHESTIVDKELGGEK